MSDGIAEDSARDDTTPWEYRVIRVGVGPVAFQKFGPDTPTFEATLNEWGKSGWEAYHVQAFADGEALLLFLKRRVGPRP